MSFRAFSKLNTTVIEELQQGRVIGDPCNRPMPTRLGRLIMCLGVIAASGLVVLGIFFGKVGNVDVFYFDSSEAKVVSQVTSIIRGILISLIAGISQAAYGTALERTWMLVAKNKDGVTLHQLNLARRANWGLVQSLIAFSEIKLRKAVFFTAVIFGFLTLWRSLGGSLVFIGSGQGNREISVDIPQFGHTGINYLGNMYGGLPRYAVFGIHDFVSGNRNGYSIASLNACQNQSIGSVAVPNGVGNWSYDVNLSTGGVCGSCQAVTSSLCSFNTTSCSLNSTTLKNNRSFFTENISQDRLDVRYSDSEEGLVSGTNTTLAVSIGGMLGTFDKSMDPHTNGHYEMVYLNCVLSTYNVTGIARYVSGKISEFIPNIKTLKPAVLSDEYIYKNAALRIFLSIPPSGEAFTDRNLQEPDFRAALLGITDFNRISNAASGLINEPSWKGPTLQNWTSNIVNAASGVFGNILAQGQISTQVVNAIGPLLVVQISAYELAACVLFLFTVLPISVFIYLRLLFTRERYGMIPDNIVSIAASTTASLSTELIGACNITDDEGQALFAKTRVKYGVSEDNETHLGLHVFHENLKLSSAIEGVRYSGKY
ncbi:hypothetical protein HK096_007536 [Nowakowskiella sp. JEL0078]|nr:hypothetical protein HK096_007536 [Nowakowskiella sp. JEL0078]